MIDTTCGTDNPCYALVQGRSETYAQWLEKLPMFDPTWDKDIQAGWFSALASIRQAFPRRMRFDVPLGHERQALISIPEDLNTRDIGFLIELLTLMRDAWTRHDSALPNEGNSASGDTQT